MASYNSAMPATAHRPAVFGAPVPLADPPAPAGTFAPGTKIQVGSHKVIIQKYFSEGGFAHVYLVKMPKPIDGTDIAVLKRVAVPDKEHLANMRTEVETMKKLKGHRAIVTYYDSHASQLKGGGYEVFLLMEFCNGGGLIDFMNTRLQNRLTEPEILKIFSDVAEGVACMHYLKPPLLHRDLKVENVLINSKGSSRRFKLCDFGSTAPPRPAATTAAECRLIEDDVQKHTTLQYRSPEMIDVYRKQPIDEKSDIWALGVLLYKLCYYTTPFEAQGQLAILNASYKYPAHPYFSDKLKKLIASMLRENPTSRPNIYQVLREACLMQGIEVPVKDIYSGRTQSESRRNQQLPSPPSDISSPPAVGVVFSPPPQQAIVIPDVVPMRRGRPVVNQQVNNSKPNRSPAAQGTAGDPFAALDSKSPSVPADEISSRFPSLDQFSLLHDGGKFDFDATSPIKPTHSRDLGQRVTEKLADDAFAIPAQRVQASTTITKPSNAPVSKAQKIISSNPELKSTSSPSVVYQPTPTRPSNSGYVSQGTMTSPNPPIGIQGNRFAPSPVQRFPPTNHNRSASLPRTEDNTPNRSPWLRPQGFEQSLPPRNSSNNLQPGHARHSSSSRPSLEGGRPSQDALDPIARTKSSNSRPRPSSTYLESNVEYLREKELGGRPSLSEKRNSSYNSKSDIGLLDSANEQDTNIASNVEFLRSMEDTESKKDRRRSSGSNQQKSKRTSLPSMSLSGTKNLLAGKFGDAFKRFEHNAAPGPGPRTPSPLQDLERRDLTPIAGSEATDGRSDDGRYEDEANLLPEQRRELERRRLSMEEKRVANAAAEYRQRLAERGSGGAPPRSIGGVSRAASIQNKVKTLLDENQQPYPVKKTAEGYGRFTDSVPTSQSNAFASQLPSHEKNPDPAKPLLTRKPVVPNVAQARTANLQQRAPDIDYSKPRAPPTTSQSQSIPAAISKTGGLRPNAPPKPLHLNSISTGGNQGSPPKSYGALSGSKIQAKPDMTIQEKEDYIKDFSRRFPSLSGIEMVETEIDGSSSSGNGVDSIGKGGLRSREV